MPHAPAGVPEIATATGAEYRGMPIMVSGVLPVLDQAAAEVRHVTVWNGIVYVSRQLHAKVQGQVRDGATAAEVELA